MKKLTISILVGSLILLSACGGGSSSSSKKPSSNNSKIATNCVALIYSGGSAAFGNSCGFAINVQVFEGSFSGAKQFSLVAFATSSGQVVTGSAPSQDLIFGACKSPSNPTGFNSAKNTFRCS